MKVAVRLFARARELAGTDTLIVDVDDVCAVNQPVTVAKLKQQLAVRKPELVPVLPNLHVAVDAEYADDATILQPHHEVACFLPVSGG